MATRRIPTRRIRILVQGVVFFLWAALILATRHPLDSWLAKTLPVSLFLRLDPLVMTVVSGGMRMGITITLLGFVTLAITLILGRVFCGWICPLGTLFDFYGYFLKKFQIPFEGPSPSWFRFKYYLLAAILIFATLGTVSPLMGFDPIVLLTRTAATVLNPFLLHSKELIWTIKDNTAFYGYFIDAATLALFLGIFAATTKLSRIWCRTACPLGAYLAVSSRYSALRRDTQGCVNCNLCAQHCPTGAINFKDETLYNESECIKCFSCSQVCPVDANFFTLKSPLPTFGKAHEPVSLERRTIVATTVFTALAGSWTRLAAGTSSFNKKLLRPPMSREERDFLSSCIRCTECVKACPTGILKAAGLEHGIRSLWSPIMVPTEGFCQPGCNACSQACPTDAIMKYTIEQKYLYKSGTAVFENSRCVSYTENKFCGECVRACPTNAITWNDGWAPEGGMLKGQGADAPAPEGKIPARPIHVEYEKCIGCGACEYQCNKIVFDLPAMLTTSQGRATPSKL